MVIGCLSAYEMQYVISQQFILIYLSVHILIKCTHKQHVIHFSNNNTQNDPNLGPIKNRAPLGPFTFITELFGYQNTPQNPKTSVLGSKPNLNTVQDCPKIVPKIMSGPSANNLENLARTVLKQSRLDCPKKVLKISKNSYTQSKKFGIEIYGLSRPLKI